MTIRNFLIVVILGLGLQSSTMAENIQQSSVTATTILRTAPAHAGENGASSCNMLNIGKENLEGVIVSIVILETANFFPKTCADLQPGFGCTITASGNSSSTATYCRVEFTGKVESVVGGLTVEDADGNSQLFLPFVQP
jgi:hypothetical protein